MAFASSLFCFLLFVFLMLVQAMGRNDSTCPKSFSCGNLTDLSFPFSLSTQPDCGIMFLSGCDAKPYPRIQLLPRGDSYYALGNPYNYTVELGDPKFHAKLRQHKCQAFNKNLSLPASPSISFKILPVNFANFFKCNSTSSSTPNITQKMKDHFAGYKRYSSCKDFSIFYKLPGGDDEDVQAGNLPANCSLIGLPIRSRSDDGGVFNKLSADFLVEWKISEDCNKCHYGRGQCQTDINNKFHCTYPYSPQAQSHQENNPHEQDAKMAKRKFGLTLGAVLGGLGLVMICLAVYFIWCCKKRRFNPPHFLSTRKLSYIFKNDVEGGSIYFGIPVFSYSELEEATNDFNSSRILGDGGFGTVYYGKLKDGREVAVKRLYEHNCKRMQQFVNEIEILTRLRHNNLVTLYGCTSRRSRELLLVYEFIPNGTLADHLHGDRVKDGSLTWLVRMNIAIETAGALAYLHASDVIHCDVKTNNILLDHNFNVKVADFGISRLFPNDVTHISTAPRGTPGYIDPKYHECYQLTSKSDVYSFGVVLVELISSMPAVDMTRHSQEINLANFAINKIVKCAFNELVDPSLGFDSDTKILEMTTSVAELAFLCLQTDRDMRPTMVEVLDTLKEIQISEFDNEKRADSNLNGNEAKIVTAPPFAESEDLRSQVLPLVSMAKGQYAKTTKSKLGVTLGAVFGGVGLVMITLVVSFIWCYKEKKFSPSRFLTTKKFSDIFKHDVEGGSIYFGVPVFSYSELEEATNDFSSSRVLGDGGFGIVYYGKLKDGREVAVKRLYEHNCRRMQQFVNEIEILTRLRHNNLVTLYGCTSRRSRELLLVYEYIPNGTLADHLHGNKRMDHSRGRFA